MVKILAHRGGVGGTDIPENTVRSFERAIRSSRSSRSSNSDNTDGIECDLRRAGSGEIVIHHDAKTKSTEQYISDMTLTELQLVCPGICTLKELLKMASCYGYTGLLNLEIKEYNIAKDLSKILLKFQHLNVFITSFLHPEVEDSQNFLSLQKRQKLGVVSFGLIYRSFPLTFADTLNKTNYHIVLSNQVIPYHNNHFLKQLSENGYKIFIYTVNDPSEMKKLMDLGFNIITDFPQLSDSF